MNLNNLLSQFLFSCSSATAANDGVLSFPFALPFHRSLVNKCNENIPKCIGLPLSLDEMKTYCFPNQKYIFSNFRTDWFNFDPLLDKGPHVIPHLV